MTRQLIASAVCPDCATTVYLSECTPDRPITAGQHSRDVTALEGISGRVHLCVHLGPDGPHRWSTDGPIEVRPVISLHLEDARPGDHGLSR